MASFDFRDDLASDVLENVTDCLGRDLDYFPKTGGQFKIRAVFNNPFSQVDPDTEVVIASNQPNILVKLAHFNSLPKKGDAFDIDSKRYHIIDVQEDGQGGAEIFLHLS